MASLNATTSSGIVVTSDNTGTLQLQTVGTNAINIDASQRAAFVAGTAAAPAITTSGDTNTGMFFPAADTIAFAEGGTEQMRLTDTGLLQFNSGYGSAAVAYGCRAWVNFNGTGTVAIRASGNVSSITDNDTGDYTVNFTTTMPDANYSVVIAASRSGNVFTTNIATNNNTGNDVAPTTGAIRIVSNGGPGRGPYDSAYFSVAIFR